MGNSNSLEIYENRVKALENRVAELEQKVFLGLDRHVIDNNAYHPSNGIFVNPSDENQIRLDDFISDDDS